MAIDATAVDATATGLEIACCNAAVLSPRFPDHCSLTNSGTVFKATVITTFATLHINIESKIYTATVERARGLFVETSAAMVHSCNGTQVDLLHGTHTAARPSLKRWRCSISQGSSSAVSTKLAYHPGLTACTERLTAHAIIAVSGTKASKA